jgi:hypothetical protein
MGEGFVVHREADLDHRGVADHMEVVGVDHMGVVHMGLVTFDLGADHMGVVDHIVKIDLGVDRMVVGLVVVDILTFDLVDIVVVRMAVEDMVVVLIAVEDMVVDNNLFLVYCNCCFGSASFILFINFFI